MRGVTSGTVLVALVLLLLLLLGATSAQKPSKHGGQFRVLNPSLNISWDGFLLPEHERRMGLLMRGDTARARAAMQRLRTTGRLRIVTMGASITAGQGRNDAYSYPEWLALWAREVWAPQLQAEHKLPLTPTVEVVLAAVPGTQSSYMSVCMGLHVPPDADVVVVEYSINDADADPQLLLNAPLRRALERLLRKLLRLPSHPAVLLLNAYAWFEPPRSFRTFDGAWHNAADADFYEYAAFYRLPLLSTKAAAFQLMRAGVPGFQVNQTRGVQGSRRPPAEDDAIKRLVWHFDRVHPNGWTGHKVMAELLVTWLQSMDWSVKRRPVTPSELARVPAPLPAPIAPGNYESVVDRCLAGALLNASVVARPPGAPAGAPGFRFLNEQPEDRSLSKWGLVAHEHGALLHLGVDTTSPNFRLNDAQFQAGTQHAAVLLGVLTSWRGVLNATVSCAWGCRCVPTFINTLSARRRVSLTRIFQLPPVTRSPNCVIQVRAEDALAPTSDQNATAAAPRHVRVKQEEDPALRKRLKVAVLIVSEEDPEGPEDDDITLLPARSFAGMDAALLSSGVRRARSLA